MRYFTDREYGSDAAALAAALEVRDKMLSAMEQGIPFEAICAQYSKKRK